VALEELQILAKITSTGAILQACLLSTAL